MDRCRDFEEEGADIVFLEAPVSTDELREFSSLMRQPVMANIVEGGKTPCLNPDELKAMGVRLAVYHPMIFAAIKAMQDSLIALRDGGGAVAPPVASFDEFKRIVGLPEYDRQSANYATGS